MPFGYSKNKGYFRKMISPIIRLANRLDKSFYDIGNLSLPILISIFGIFINTKYQGWIILSNIVLLIGAIYCLIKVNNDKENLVQERNNYKNENEKLTNQNKGLLEEMEIMKGDFRLLNKQSIENHLKIINNTIGCSSCHSISLYFEYNGLFLILGRFSENPKLSIINTTQFPLDKGALSKTWEQEYFEDFSCPVFSNNKDSKKKYYDYQKSTYDFSKQKASSLNMKSCNYIGIRIKDNGIPIGVILFESIQNDLLSKKRINSWYLYESS